MNINKIRAYSALIGAMVILFIQFGFLNGVYLTGAIVMLVSFVYFLHLEEDHSKNTEVNKNGKNKKTEQKK